MEGTRLRGNIPAPLPTHSCFMTTSSSKATRTSVAVCPSFRKETVKPQSRPSRIKGVTFRYSWHTWRVKASCACQYGLHSTELHLASYLARAPNVAHAALLDFDERPAQHLIYQVGTRNKCGNLHLGDELSDLCRSCSSRHMLVRPPIATRSSKRFGFRLLIHLRFVRISPGTKCPAYCRCHRPASRLSRGPALGVRRA